MGTILGKIKSILCGTRVSVMAACLFVVALTLAIVSSYILKLVGDYALEQRLTEMSAQASIAANFAAQTDFQKDSLEISMSRLDIVKNARVIFIDNDSKVIYDNNGALINYFSEPLALQSLKGESGKRSYQREGILMVSAATPITINKNIVGGVFVQASAEDITELNNRIAGGMLLVSVIVCLFVILLSYFLAHVLTMPLLVLAEKIKEMSEMENQSPVHVKGPTEINQLVEAFNRMVMKINEQEAKRLEFVSDASHEIKTPLASIKLIADSILVQNPPMDIVRDFLSDMNMEVERLTRIVNKLLSLTKMDDEQNRHANEFTTINLKELCSEAIKSVTPLAMQKQVSLTFDAGADTFMLLDGDRLWEAVYNLLDNSIKYNIEGGTVDMTVRRDPHNVYITVTDSGIGVEQDEIPKIFDRFYRVDKARARDTGGTGLGLSIAQSAARMHGGEITVKSTKGEGSTFTIRLPIGRKNRDKKIVNKL